MKLMNIKYILFAALLVLSSCIVVKHDEQSDVTPIVTLSPKPEIEMSDLLVRSKQGDLIALMPKDWFFVDVNDRASADVFAIAVNPEYSLSAVFAQIRPGSNSEDILNNEGLLGLARMSLNNKSKRTAGGIRQSGKFSPIEIGTKKFVSYDYTTSNGLINSRAIVFISTLNNYYEFALMPMDITSKPKPDSLEFDRIFRSIVSTIEF